MLVIRLFRTGKSNQPQFKIVVTDKKNPPRGGRFLEVVGSYSPLTKKKDLKAERIMYWMSVGAKPSPTVFNFLVAEKIIEGKKIPKHKKAKKKTEVKPAGEPVAATVQPEKKSEPVSPAQETTVPPEKPVEIKTVPETAVETKTPEEKQTPEKPAEEKKEAVA